jgi:tRNA dimethylallyltransferase
MRGKPVVCLMGPTASGKTAVAMHLADEFSMDLVSVDSALVYRGMDIGTAKPGADELRRHPHHLIDIREPEESYSAGDFVRDANELIESIHAAGRVPLLVGGTMMYFRSLIDGIANLPAADPQIRTAIDQDAAEKGWPALHAELAQVDPVTAKRVNANDAQRIQRALEVFRVSGKPLSTWQSATRPGRHDFIKLALLPEPRSDLHAKIEARLDQMLESGFINEIKKLMKHTDLTGDHGPMRAVGYRQFWSYVSGDIGFEEARSMALAATRQLAKRQLTWLRSEQDVYSVNPLEIDGYGAMSAYLRERLVAA